MPPHYEQVIQFADTTRNDFGEIRKNRPANTAEIKMALDGFLNNCKFQNIIINKGYIDALGLQ
jgi:hypothetical protein